MEALFVGNSVIILFWVYLNFVVEIEEKYKKVILMYLVTYITNILNVVPTVQSYVILLLALFIETEFWDDNFKMKIMNSIFDKILDFIYTMIFQRGLISFSISLLICSNWWLANFDGIVPWIMQIISGIIVYISCKNVTRERFKTISFTDIKAKIDAILKYRDFIKEKKSIDYPQSVLMIEDRSFFERGEKRHTFLNSYYFKIGYIKKLIRKFKSFIYSYEKKESVKRFLRGYSTIEMQLLRTLAVEDGYDCVFRRKIYEVIYSRLFYKNLKKYYKECRCETYYFKEYILYLYLRVAPCLNVGGEKKVEDVFNKKRNRINEYTKEQLFILTLCFSGKIKREYVLDIYEDVICDCDMDREKLKYYRNRLN